MNWDEYGEDVISSLLLACYDVDTCSFQAVCRVHYDEDTMKETMEELMDYGRHDKDPSFELTAEQECDIWFDPVMVWEVQVSLDAVVCDVQFVAGMMKNGSASCGVGFDGRFDVEFVGCLNEDCICNGTDKILTSDQLLEIYNVSGGSEMSALRKRVDSQ